MLDKNIWSQVTQDLIIVPVALYVNKRVHKTQALVDLGCTLTFITSSLADKLKIEQSFGGLGQSMSGSMLLNRIQCGLRARGGPLITGEFTTLDPQGMLQALPVDVVLGLDYLRAGKALIDVAHKKVKFQSKKSILNRVLPRLQLKDLVTDKEDPYASASQLATALTTKLGEDKELAAVAGELQKTVQSAIDILRARETGAD